MVLIDTSSWVHFLRTDGLSEVRARVETILRSGNASWCPLVRLELWNGAGGDRERKILREFERVVSELPITPEVWTEAYDLARRCRAAGVTAPASDLLITACARHHGVRLEHADADFDRISDVAGPSGDRDDSSA
jgi:predicted nucleic acid-binding protein